MECNKDEAIRAKGIAEMKMQNNDFEGARKIALKAQQLFPELENISQLLTVCDVHCSAQNKIHGSEKDWYATLQVERLADEATIKKQYRKLALVLHPDKNKFPGAEAAFKLIGEANLVLSDRGKRYLYDSKYRVSVRTAATKPPPHQVNQNQYIRKQCGFQNNFPDVSNSQFGGLNRHQSTQPDLSNGRHAFWTCCPFCNIKYQYYKDFVNKALHCPKCKMLFIAYDLGGQGVIPGSSWGQPGSQGVAAGSTWSQPAFSREKQVPSREPFKVGAQGAGEFPSSHLGSHVSSGKTVGKKSMTRPGSTSNASGGSKTKGKEGRHANKESGKEGSGMSEVHAVKSRESGTSRNTRRKRGRKMVVESSESCKTASSSDSKDLVIQDNNGNPVDRQNSALHHPRRSSRQRQHMSYNESANDNDEDFVSPPKRSRGSKSSSNRKDEQKEAADNEESEVSNSTGFPAAVDGDHKNVKCKGNAPSGESMLDRNGEPRKQVNGKEAAATVDLNPEEIQVVYDSDSSSSSDCASHPESYDCLDAEFNDFDKHKEGSCFAVAQIWACYDTLDGMPRFYALVRKVSSSGFKLRITWLEADPEDDGETDWVSKGLPVACGKFVHGNSEETSVRLMFSHLVYWEKGRTRGSYLIYPRRGETWALFRDWNITWSSDADNHKKYKFEIVEVLSEFSKDAGIMVAYLDKVEGFVSLFQQTTRGGIASYMIPSSELLRFSHRISSFKMRGIEREGVPEGSFELDPASLPTNPNELCHPDEADMKTESTDAKDIGFCPKSPEKMGSKKMTTPKKCVGFEGKNDSEREMFKIRRSPRVLKSRDKKCNQVNASQCSAHEAPAKHLHGTLDTRHDDFTPSKGNASSSRADEEKHSSTKNTRSTDLLKRPSIPSTSSPGRKISDKVFYNFNGDRSERRFQPGQIWAMYSNNDRLPKNYAQVKNIESSPFALHVASLEACTMSKDKMQPVCCGTFKVQKGKGRLFSPSSFSHVLKAESIGRNRFEIYPKVGEIWALYKDWNADLSSSELENSKYEIVEVLEDNEKCLKVSYLVRLYDYKSVFKTPRRQRSSTGIVEIPRSELAQFSHQIPAFQLTGEKDSCLKDCWELDPAAVPGNLLHIN